MPADIGPYEVIPATEDDLTPDEEIAAIEFPDEEPELPSAGPRSFGMSWLFDFGTNRMRRYGTAPAAVQDRDSAIMVCQVALRIWRGDLPIFDDEFGMDEPDRMIGHTDIVERLAEYEQDIVDTLIAAHERVIDVRDFNWDLDSDSEVAEHSCELIFDDETSATMAFPTVTS